MTKYQEALDTVKSSINVVLDKGRGYELVKHAVDPEVIKTLQELINKYNKALSILSKNVPHLQPAKIGNVEYANYSEEEWDEPHAIQPSGKLHVLGYAGEHQHRQEGSEGIFCNCVWAM